MQPYIKFLYAMALLTFFLMASSCSGSQPEASAEAETTAASDVPSSEEPATMTAEPAPIANMVIAENQVGDFAIEQPMPEGGYTVAKEMKTSQSEGETEEVPVYMVKDGETLLLEISPAYDIDAAAYTDQPGDIVVHSDRFKTAQGMGVGNTVEELMAAYGDVELWYTYVSGMFVAQSKSLAEIQFLIDPTAYVGQANLEDSDRVDLTPADFKPNAPVVSVRVYYDRVGNTTRAGLFVVGVGLVGWLCSVICADTLCALDLFVGDRFGMGALEWAGTGG